MLMLCSDGGAWCSILLAGNPVTTGVSQYVAGIGVKGSQSSSVNYKVQHLLPTFSGPMDAEQSYGDKL